MREVIFDRSQAWIVMPMKLTSASNKEKKGYDIIGWIFEMVQAFYFHCLGSKPNSLDK
jgi:hypothetical protein